MHFKKSSDTLFGLEKRADCTKKTLFLQPVNPRVCFVSREDYIRTITLPASDNGQQIIYKSQKMNKVNKDRCFI